MRVAKPKRCPFCGSSHSFTECMDIGMWQRVCNDCFTHGPSVYDDGRDLDDDKADAYAIRAWNKQSRGASRPLRNGYPRATQSQPAIL